MKGCDGMNNYISENAILRFAIDNGIIDCATIQQQIELKQREEYLKKHNNSIWQDKNGYWKTYINDVEDGRKKRRLLKRKNKSDLEDMIVELYQAEDLNTFKNRYNKWIERQRICGRASETIYKYKADYKRFFKGYPIETMDIADINDEVLSMHITAVLEEKPIRWRALKGIFGYINGVFKKSIMDRVLPKDSNPCDYIDLPMFRHLCAEEEGKTAEERTLSDKERKVLLDKLHNPKAKNVNMVANFAIELALYTGMRVGELAALRWEDINTKQEYIRICHSEKRDRENNTTFISTTKNDKVRILPLTDEIMDVLKRTKEYELSKGYLGEFVFQNETGRLHATIISKCARAKTRSDDFTNQKSIHAIRRTLNSNMRCAGVSATAASSLLGHTVRVNEYNYTYDTIDMSTKKMYIEKAGKII